MRTISIYLVFLSFCIMSCKSKKTVSEAPSSANPVAFEEITKQAFSGLSKAENIYIDNAADWAEFWSRAHSSTTPAPASPKIDFSQTLVLAACMGMQNSGGHKTEITQTKIAGETVYVSVVNYSPGAGCMSTMAITYPYHVVQIPKGSIKEAVFSTEERVDDCK